MPRKRLGAVDRRHGALPVTAGTASVAVIRQYAPGSLAAGETSALSSAQPTGRARVARKEGVASWSGGP